MTTYGKVETVSQLFEWRIDNFFSLPVDGWICYSPPFTFENESWLLSINPNGRPDKNSVGHIDLFLHRSKSGRPIHLSVSLSFKTLNGKRDGERQFTHVFENRVGKGYFKFMERSTLLVKRVQLVPSDTLTIVCKIEHDSTKSTYDTAIQKLIDDMKKIFNSHKHSDVIIKVKDEEFRLHKNILAGRSPYFSSMFETDTKEKFTGIVTIEDCEVETFRNYAHFIYTGKVAEMTVGNICDLYEVAVKFQEHQLKMELLCFMRNEMSVDSVCDFIALALKHDEKDLLDTATDFFCKHTKEIIQSVKWKTLLSKYPMQANELYIKAHDSKCK